MDGLMRRAASDSATLALPFSFYYIIGHSSHFSLLLEPIYRVNRGLGLITTSQFYFLCSSVEVCHVKI
jgi:hypothetical protein